MNGSHRALAMLATRGVRRVRAARIEAPSFRRARPCASPSGARIVFVESGKKPSPRVQVYGVDANRWTEIVTPGIVAWEPLRSR